MLGGRSTRWEPWEPLQHKRPSSAAAGFQPLCCGCCHQHLFAVESFPWVSRATARLAACGAAWHTRVTHGNCAVRSALAEGRVTQGRASA